MCSDGCSVDLMRWSFCNECKYQIIIWFTWNCVCHVLRVFNSATPWIVARQASLPFHTVYGGLDGTTYSMDMSVSRLQELAMDIEAWHAAVHGVTKSWTQLSNWTELRLLCPWNFWGKNTGLDCHFLLQGFFPNQESNPHLLCMLYWRQTLCYVWH